MATARSSIAAKTVAATSLFGGLDEPTISLLADRALTRSFTKNDFVFHEGDDGNSMYVVAEGLIKVFVTSEEGTEIILATLEPPQTFGELAIIDGGPRTASAKAMRDSTLLAFTRDTFQEMLHAYPQLVTALHSSLGALLRRVLEQASDLVFLDLPGRVAKLLLRLAEDKGEQHPEGIRLDLNVSQGSLASMVGGSRPSVNQILRALESRGYIEVQGRSILIREPDLLRRRANL